MSVPPSGPSIGRSRRVVAAGGVVLLLAVPMVVLFGLLWNGRMSDYHANQQERRGARYLAPLTDLISTLAAQESNSVRGRPTDGQAVQHSIAGVDAVNRDLGDDLGVSDRWAKLKQSVLDVTGKAYSDPNDGFTAYSELLSTAVEMVRKIGDTSQLILDPKLDTYYVMNAAMLRIPDIIIDGARYSDLAYLIVQRKQTNQVAPIAALDTARLDVTESAADLEDGLEKAFDATSSDTLGPALLRQLDNFRTAVAALAPPTSPVQPSATKIDPGVIGNNQEDLQRTALDLDQAALGQLDASFGKRISGAVRGLVLAGAVLAVGLGLAVGAVFWFPNRQRDRAESAAPPAPPPARPVGRHGDRRGDPDSVDARELVASSGLAVPPRRGGTRAAR
jgi:hypothetical protein